MHATNARAPSRFFLVTLYRQRSGVPVNSEIAFRDGRRVNLADGVAPEVYAELEGTQGRGSQAYPLLFCGGCGGGVYIRHGSARRNKLFGAHFAAGDCTVDLTVRKSIMSPQHRWMQEYHVRPVIDAGYSADLEVPTSARTRVDVVIDGRIGIEVQWSGLTAGAAVRRTARSMAAGLEAVAWCGTAEKSAWTGKVPGYQWLDNGQFLQGMPRPRSVRSRGLLAFRPVRSWRGDWEPRPEPLTLLVDEAVVRLAEGTVKPVTVGKFVQLVTSEGISLYEDMTGLRLIPFAGGRTPPRALTPSAEGKCGRPPAIARPGTGGICREPECGEAGRPYENGDLWLCTGHAWQHYVFREKDRAPGQLRPSSATYC